MLENYEKTISSVNHLHNAMVATRDIKEAKFFKEPQSLVGVYYDTPFLPKQVIAHPVIRNVNYITDDKEVLSIGILLKTSPSDIKDLEVMETLLVRTGLGEFDSPLLGIKPQETSDNPISRFQIQSSVVSDIEDTELLLRFNTGMVYKQDFRINKVQYTQYELVGRGYISGEVHEHRLYLLFKDKQSDGESFFSAFVNKKLNKTDSLKVLDAMKDKNITGYGIGGIHSFTNRTHTTYSIIPYVSEMVLLGDEGMYSFSAIEGGVNIRADNIRNVTVSTTGDRNYIVDITTDDTLVQVMLA